MKLVAIFATLAVAAQAADADLEKMRDRQDKAGIEQSIAMLSAEARKKSSDASIQYRLALAHHYLAEVALEENDRARARDAAENGIRAAERAIALKPASAEYHRIRGTLCGQVIPANVLAGLRYGRCAMDEINKALELDPKSARVWMSKGVGNYYLPPAFGGGVELAIRDFQKALQLDPRLADAHLWLGIALRKANRPAEARRALEKAIELNPRRVWAARQLGKTPGK